MIKKAEGVAKKLSKIHQWHQKKKLSSILTSISPDGRIREGDRIITVRKILHHNMFTDLKLDDSLASSGKRTFSGVVNDIAYGVYE